MKFSHANVAYEEKARGRDNCMNCKSYYYPDNCRKVVAPISPGGWCRVGTSKHDGSRYDPRGPAIERMAGKRDDGGY